jgi:hypothetical protein
MEIDDTAGVREMVMEVKLTAETAAEGDCALVVVEN